MQRTGLSGNFAGVRGRLAVGVAAAALIVGGAFASAAQAQDSNQQLTAAPSSPQLIELRSNGFSDNAMEHAVQAIRERSDCDATYTKDGVFEGGIEVISNGEEEVAFDEGHAVIIGVDLCKS